MQPSRCARGNVVDTSRSPHRVMHVIWPPLGDWPVGEIGRRDRQGTCVERS